MKKNISVLFVVLSGIASLIVIAGCKSIKPTEPRVMHAPKTLSAFQAAAAQYNSVISIPDLEATPDAIKLSLTNTIKEANAALDKIGALKSSEVNFTNTVRALDDLGYRAGLFANRISLMKETSTNAAIRDASTEAVKIFQDWS